MRVVVLNSDPGGTMDKEKIWMVGVIVFMLFLWAIFVATFLFVSKIAPDSNVALASAIVAFVLVGYLGYRLRVAFDELIDWIVRKRSTFK